jgi:polysaccharide biosynthesis protein PslG
VFPRLIPALAFTSFVVGACAPFSPSAPAPVPAITSSPASVSKLDYGIHLFIADHPQTTERDLRMVTDASFHWQKSLFKWREIEGAAKGRFDWTDADRVVRASRGNGLKILARLDFEPMWARKDQAHNGPPDNYQDYWDFVSAFVKRYRGESPIGRVDAIEIWNEPNLDREWGNQAINTASAADYVRLLAGAYQAAHAANPEIIVISAGLSPNGVTNGHSADDLQYLQWMYDAGLQGKFDVLGAHANTQAPEVAASPGSLKDFPHASFYFRRIEQLRQLMVEHGDATKQIWLTEWGWTSDTVHQAFAWFAVSEDKKADNLVQAFKYARENWSTWIGVMSVWTLPDPSWTRDDEEYWWAIANPDGTPRPAYLRIRDDRRNGVLP